MLNPIHQNIQNARLLPKQQAPEIQWRCLIQIDLRGMVSVTVVITFVILFSNMGLKTLGKETITSSSYTENEITPSEISSEKEEVWLLPFEISKL